MFLLRCFEAGADVVFIVYLEVRLESHTLCARFRTSDVIFRHCEAIAEAINEQEIPNNKANNPQKKRAQASVAHAAPLWILSY